MSGELNAHPAQEIGRFVTYAQTLNGDEKGEAQVFCDRLFQAFGHAGYKEAGATLEYRVRTPGGHTKYADLLWKPRLLLEMKRRGTKLDRHYSQAFDYWVRLVPDRPRYVVLSNFDEFWIYDFNTQVDEPVDTVPLKDLPSRYTAFNLLLPTEKKPQFRNDLVAVTRGAAEFESQYGRAPSTRGEGPRVDPAEFTKEFGEPPPINFDTHKKVIEEFKNFAVGAFQGIAGGFGSMIQAFLMGGNAAGQSFGKMAKAVLSSLAAQALVESLMEVARGLAALANPFTAWQAPLHFAAAKAFALVGGVAAGIALAIPGGGGGGGGASDLAAGGSGRESGRSQYEREQADRDRNTIREARRGGAPDPNIPTVHIVIHDNVKTEPGMFRERVVEVVGNELHAPGGRLMSGVNNAVVRAYRDSHSIRDTIRNDMGYV